MARQLGWSPERSVEGYPAADIDQAKQWSGRRSLQDLGICSADAASGLCGGVGTLDRHVMLGWSRDDVVGDHEERSGLCINVLIVNDKDIPF